MNRIRFARGDLRAMNAPFSGELFFDVFEKSLYVWINSHWVLVGGALEQMILSAGDNIEIIEKGEQEICEIRLKDDIDINTMTLRGTDKKGPVWKGMIKLGEIENSSAFPLVDYDPNSAEIIGGKIICKYLRNGKEDYGTYQITAAASGKASVSNATILGADGSAIKDTIGLITLKNGKRFLALKTHTALQKTIEYVTIEGSTSRLQSTVNICLDSYREIHLESEYGKVSLHLTGFANTCNVSAEATGNQWYEASMDDFRLVTGIPLETGLSIDQFGSGSYIYFDIYSKENSFSIDRVFVTHGKSKNEDQIVSEGRIFCHDPYWMTPNDKHTVDISDSFTLSPDIFTSTSDNNRYVSGAPQFLFSVDMIVNQSSHQVATVTTKYLPPEKIEIWFNGWDFRVTKNFPKFSESDISYYTPLTLEKFK